VQHGRFEAGPEPIRPSQLLIHDIGVELDPTCASDRLDFTHAADEQLASIRIAENRAQRPA
jgi:hypothetical protein